VANGLVITTEPAPGTKQPLGLTITLVISQGPAAIVPDVVHRTQGAAMALIEAAHLNVGVTPVTIPGIEPLYVTAQSPDPGTQEKRGATVMISVEQPNATTTTTTTPSVSGISSIP